MVKTQVQFPDNLYDEAKRIAAAQRWELPAARRMGAPLIPEEEWDLASRDEA